MAMKTDPICLDDYEKLAQSFVDEASWRYFATGADEEETLRRNRAALRRILIRPKSLHQDVSRVDLSSQLVGGTGVPHPIGVSPSAFHSYAHSRGELATAEGAAGAGAVYTISPWATKTLAEIRASAGAQAPLWQDVYIFEERDATVRMIREAEAIGCKAIVVSVDIPVLSKRRRYHAFTAHFIQRLADKNFWPPMVPKESEQRYRAGDPAATWDDFANVVKCTQLPVIAKGVTTGLDATRALAAGAGAIWVSTHGGRQLDSSPASIEVLPEVAAAIAGRCPIYIDSGFRTGTDVFKAFALGASAVSLGRPIIHGLAVDGAKGVADVIRILRDELHNVMQLAGCAKLSDITSDFVATHFPHI